MAILPWKEACACFHFQNKRGAALLQRFQCEALFSGPLHTVYVRQKLVSSYFYHPKPTEPFKQQPCYQKKRESLPSTSSHNTAGPMLQIDARLNVLDYLNLDLYPFSIHWANACLVQCMGCKELYGSICLLLTPPATSTCRDPPLLRACFNRRWTLF